MSSSSSRARPSLTISLIILSFLFLIMTTPGTIMFAYFYNAFLSNLDESIVFLIDDISFVNHTMLFFISFVSNRKFRRTVLGLAKSSCSNGRHENYQQSQASSFQSTVKNWIDFKLIFLIIFIHLINKNVRLFNYCWNLIFENFNKNNLNVYWNKTNDRIKSTRINKHLPCGFSYSIIIPFY